MNPGRYREQSVILNRLAYGEADLIVTFLTRRQGKFKGMAKHGRKSRKRFAGGLSPPSLTCLEFTVKPGRDLVMLESAEVEQAYEAVTGDVRRLALGSVTLELVDAFWQPQDPSPDVFDLLTWCLGRLEAGLRLEEAVLIFMLRLLTLAGYQPNLSSCAVCGRPLEPGRPASLHADHAAAACRSCLPGGFPARAGTLKTLERMQTLAPDKLDRLRIGVVERSEAEPFLLAQIRHTLGRDLKSLRFLEQLDGMA